MCGIIAVIRRPSNRAVPTRDDILGLVSGTADGLDGVALEEADGPLANIAERLATADALLRGTPGLRLLLSDPGLSDVLRSELGVLNSHLDALEADLDSKATVDSLDLEAVNALLISARDGAWAIERDRLRAGEVVSDLGGRDVHGAGIDAIFSVHQALSALDRMEVRGRDSAGLHLLVSNHGLDLVQSISAARVGLVVRVVSVLGKRMGQEGGLRATAPDPQVPVHDVVEAFVEPIYVEPELSRHKTRWLVERVPMMDHLPQLRGSRTNVTDQGSVLGNVLSVTSYELKIWITVESFKNRAKRSGQK